MLFRFLKRIFQKLPNFVFIPDIRTLVFGDTKPHLEDFVQYHLFAVNFLRHSEPAPCNHRELNFIVLL